MKYIKEIIHTKRIIKTCLYAAVLPVILLTVFCYKVRASGTITLKAPDRFFDRNKCLTVTIEGNDADHTIGLIADAFSGGQTVERRFKTIDRPGQVTFDAFSGSDLFDFRVIAVDKTTLAPVCDALVLTRTIEDDEIEITESHEIIPALPAGTATALKAVTKDLILAEEALDNLEDLCSETISVEYEENVVSDEVNEDGVTVTMIRKKTKTSEMSRYDAISVNDDALSEAADRLDKMKSAYKKLQISAAVLYQLAKDNEQIRSYALHAGDIAKTAASAETAIKTVFSMKQEQKDLNNTGLLSEITQIRKAHQIIDVCGGSVLMDGGFCTYPKGAELALISDEDSSAVILHPDNGKVTKGTVKRTDFAESMSNIVITTVNSAAELATITAYEEPCFRKYDGFEVNEQNIVTDLTKLEYPEDTTDREKAVLMLTAYAHKTYDISSYGTYETYEQIEEAFLTSTDDSAATLSALSGGSLEIAEAAFTAPLTAEYNSRRGYTEYWSCGDPDLIREDYYGIHCTLDSEGNMIGLYESFENGVQGEELYFTSPVPDRNKDRIPDSRQGCIYEKTWRRTDYSDPDAFEDAAKQPGYDPANIRVHIYEEYEYGGSVNTPLSNRAEGVPGGNGFSISSIDTANDYDDPEGQPSVQVCHFKRYYDNDSGQLEIESVAVYNPSLWEYYRDNGFTWNQGRSRSYNILRQRNYSRNGQVKREYTYAGAVSGYAFDDVVIVKDYDLTGDTPMLEYEYHECARDMTPTLYAYIFQNFDTRSAIRAYYTPEYFTNDERAKRVPVDKRELFYGKLKHYRSPGREITGYNFLGSWKDTEGEENIRFSGADEESFPADMFMDESHHNVGFWHVVLRDTEFINSKYEMIYRISDNL